LLTLGPSAHALSLSYEFGGITYGTMNISANLTSDILTVQYDANSPLPGSAEVTGFGFTFNPGTAIPGAINNPADVDFGWDEDDLDWIKLDNLNAIPNPANSSLSKTDFLYGVTEGNSNNFNPPGILAGQSDVFYLDFSAVFDLYEPDGEEDLFLADFIQYTGIRIQSLPDNVNGGSLFLVGTPDPDTPNNSVPEPATMLLLGIGLVGLAGFGREKFFK
jgi:hypothetical protein